MTVTEEQRATELLEAQAKAEALFHEVEARGLIRPGITENGLNSEIYGLAQEMYGISTYWHKRIVRAGKNTLSRRTWMVTNVCCSWKVRRLLGLTPHFHSCRTIRRCVRFSRRRMNMASWRLSKFCWRPTS